GERHLTFRRGQGVAHDLLQSATDQKVAQALFENQWNVGLLARQAIGKERCRQAVVAIDARQLLDQIRSARLNVKAMRGNSRTQRLPLVLDAKLQAPENSNRVGLGKLHAK